MKIQAVDHIQVTTTSSRIDDVLYFYQQVMGLVPVAKPDALAGNGGGWFQVGDQQLHVSIEKGDVADAAQSKRHICYRVDDLNHWQDHLDAKGVPWQPDHQPIPGCVRLFLRDPAGNRIELMQILDA
ncbi:VOC family protein [Aestuariispira ectoiniformans]|uniref:VOC family protein n=1 Tax=Aestuariispira ectoiniformans TaxID=2775080 RepID=UPI00223A76C0|nr:VOC family protein [Aestuariispira ectoiniformans]